MIALIAIFAGLIVVGTEALVGVGLGVGADVGVGLDLGVDAGVGLGLGLGVGAGLGLDLDADVGVGLGLGVDAGVGVGLGLGLDAGVGLGLGNSYGYDNEIGAGFGVYGSGCAGGRCGQISYGGSGVDLSLAADGITSFAGPYCPDYYRGFGCCSSYNWPCSAYGGLPYGSFGVVGTNLPYLGYNGYGQTDYIRENFVQNNVYGATEFGSRNEIRVRPGVPSYPYPYRYRCVGYPNCLPQPYPVDIPRPVYPYAPGLVTAGEVQRVGLPDFQYR